MSNFIGIRNLIKDNFLALSADDWWWGLTWLGAQTVCVSVVDEFCFVEIWQDEQILEIV